MHYYIIDIKLLKKILFMKKIVFIASLLMFGLIANSQSIERFIRIVGNSSYMFISDAYKVEITVSEVGANEYKKTESITYEDAYKSLIAKLKDLNIDASKLIEDEFVLNSYNKALSRKFILELKKTDNIENIFELKSNGIELNSLLYSYNVIPTDIEQRMVLECIEDAKRKAKNICEEINMKLGKVLNIEDSTGGCCGSIKESKESKTLKNYSVLVTFELKDK